MAMVNAIAQCFVDQQTFVAGLPAAFDLDTAQGVQLDAVGLWIGLSRNLAVPVTGVYFSWDTAGVGWDEGVWQGPSDPTQGISTLEDNAYRFLLRAKVAANHWNGSNGTSQTILNSIFNPVGMTPILTDNQDMSMSVQVYGSQFNALYRAIITQGYVPVRPVGVNVNYTIQIYSLKFDGTWAFDGSETFNGIKV